MDILRQKTLFGLNFKQQYKQTHFLFSHLFDSKFSDFFFLIKRSGMFSAFKKLVIQVIF